MSQVEFAEVFGVSDGSAVSRWEKGRRVPDEIVQRLFRYIDDLPDREAREVIRRFRNYGRK